jgi:hypothetical protein
MTVNAQFGSIQELETAFRAIVLFKFSGSGDADVYLGSPVMANAATGMLESIQAHWISAEDSRRAEGWRDLYLVSNAERHVEIISSCAIRHPKWASLSRQERLDWIQIIAAPYRLDEAGLEFFHALIGD